MQATSEADFVTREDPMNYPTRQGFVALLVAAIIPCAFAQTFDVVEGESQATYTAREQLVRIGFNEVVGTTPDVTGSIVLGPDGVVEEGSRVVVDVSQLRTNEARRDNYLRRNSLQTDAYPTVTFVVTALQGLPWPLPTEGKASFQIQGDLTVRDVTRPTTWQATATVDGERLRLQAYTTITFDDFEMRQPTVALVLSIEPSIRLDVDLALLEHVD